ncbi:hypothetical protein DWZ66_08190 [Coprobacillus sp. AF34-1BH]|nr:hypothetical protein DWX19_01525 [Coprobacillus sp. AF18-40]RGT87305.1 hypothetical protein DWX05_02095 [Coprobacillus sp. AF18-15LB]RHP24252.1 hypothetical protein DWZ66_08190 [Coprobacillus sp. AF34-1BH]
MINEIAGNFLLCEKYDEETNSIVNIFDNLYVDENLQANFDVVLQINIYSSEKYSPNKYHIYTFFKENNNHAEGLGMYLGKIQLPPDDKKEHTKDIHSYRHRHTFSLRDLAFPKIGSYYIECFVSDKEYPDDNISKLYKNVASPETLLDTLTFNVKVKS